MPDKGIGDGGAIMRAPVWDDVGIVPYSQNTVDL